MKFNKILVTGFDLTNLDEKVWERINKLTNQVVFQSSKDIDCLFPDLIRLTKS